MKRLKLLKPWHLPAVRLTLDAPQSEPCALFHACGGAPGGAAVAAAAPEASGARLEVTAARPWERHKHLRAPRGNATFAGTAIPHTGCPHLSI